MPTLSLYALHLRLFVMKRGAANLVVALLALLAALAYLLAIPYSAEKLRAQQQILKQLKQTRDAPVIVPAALPRAVNDERAAQFYTRLGERDYAEQQLKTLFAIAAKTSLTLQQADYKWVDDGAGRFTAYHVELPVKGSYAAIQQFCEKVLLNIPFASLDQLNFRRDAAGDSAIEAKLSFTLYLAGQAPPDAVKTDLEKDE